MTTARLPLLCLAVLATALLAGCGGGDDGVTITPMTHDFGRVHQGDMPTKRFTIHNGTSRVLSVMPQPNCSCFAVERGRSLKPIDPGETIEVNVLFDSTAKEAGPVQGKWITFNLDDPKQRKIIVPLKGEIYKSYDLTPNKLMLGRIDGNPRNYKARVLTLRPRQGYKLAFGRVVSSPDVFDVETTQASDGATEIALRLKRGGPTRPLGAFKALVRVEFELTNPHGVTFSQRPSLTVEGYWAIRPDGTGIRMEGGSRRR